MGRLNKHEQPSVPQGDAGRIDIATELAMLHSFSNIPSDAGRDVTEEIPSVNSPYVNPTVGPMQNGATAHDRTAPGPRPPESRADSARRLRESLDREAAIARTETKNEKLIEIQKRLALLRAQTAMDSPSPSHATPMANPMYPGGYAMPTPGAMPGGYPYGYPYTPNMVPGFMPPAQVMPPTGHPAQGSEANDAVDSNSSTPDLPVATFGLPTTNNEQKGESSKEANDEKHDRKKLRFPWPSREHKTARLVAFAAVGALAVGGVGVGVRNKINMDEAKRLNAIKAEGAKFEGGLMPDFLNCRDPKNMLTLDMAADTTSGLQLNIRFMNVKTGKEVMGYMPKEAHMVGNLAVGMCAAGDGKKTLAKYVNGQIEIDRSAVKLDSLRGVEIPPCDLVLAPGQPWSCGVALFPPTYPIVEGHELTLGSPFTSTYKIINEAEQKRAVNLAKVPEGSVKTLTVEQRQALAVANAVMFEKMINNADKSCVSDVDKLLVQKVMPEFEKKFDALPSNKTPKLVGSYGQISKGVTDKKGVQDLVNTKLVSADGLQMRCNISPGEPKAATPSKPTNSSPPSTQPTPARTTTTTNGARP